MGRKSGGIASIFSSKPNKHAATDSPSSAPWPWPSCATTPQTASFRRPGRRHGDDEHRPCTTAARRRPSATGRLRPPRDEMYKTVNSVFDAADSGRFFFDDDGGADPVADGGLDDDDDDGFSTTTASEEWSEAVIRSLGRTSTDRFFFDSGPAAPASNSILAASPSPGRSRTTLTSNRAPAPPPQPLASRLQALSTAAAEPGLSDDDLEEDDEPASSTSLVEESVAVALESSDPFGDFRASMEEMVAAHGLRDWPHLQEMLLWYLRINGKRNHALIVGAFVDLLVGLATNNGRNGASAVSTATTAATTTTTATMTTTASARSTSTSSSSSRSSGSSSGGDVTTTAAAAATMALEEEEEQCCGGGSVGASCSSASSSDLDEEEEKASDSQCTEQ